MSPDLSIEGTEGRCSYLAQIIDDDRLLRGYGHLSDGALRDGSTAGAGNTIRRYPVCGSEIAERLSLEVVQVDTQSVVLEMSEHFNSQSSEKLIARRLVNDGVIDFQEYSISCLKIPTHADLVVEFENVNQA